MKQFLILVMLAVTGMAQTPAPTISAVQIYQSAQASGVNYVPPQAGQVIVTEKAALNLKNIILTGLGQATISTAIGGITKFITIRPEITAVLVIGYVAYEAWIMPNLKNAAPNPNIISPILTMTSTMGIGSENSIIASSIRGVPAAIFAKMSRAKRKNNVVMPDSISLQLNGMLVTLTPQGDAFTQDTIGSNKKDKVIIVDVLVGPLPGSAVLKTDLEMGSAVEHGFSEIDSRSLNGMIAANLARADGVEMVQSK